MQDQKEQKTPESGSVSMNKADHVENEKQESKISQVEKNVINATLDPYDILVQSQRNNFEARITVSIDKDPVFKIKEGKAKTEMTIRDIPRMIDEPMVRREYLILDYDLSFATVYDLIEGLYAEMQNRMRDIFTYHVKPITETILVQGGADIADVMVYTQFGIPEHFFDEYWTFRPEVAALRTTLSAYKYRDNLRGFCNIFCSKKFNGLLNLADGYVARNGAMAQIFENTRRIIYWRTARTMRTQIADRFIYQPYADYFFLVDIMSYLRLSNDFTFMLYGTYLNFSVSSSTVPARELVSGANFTATKSNPLVNFLTQVLPTTYSNDLKMILWSIFMMGYIRLEIVDDLQSWHPESRALVGLMARLLLFFNGDQVNSTGNITFSSARLLDHYLADVIASKMNSNRINLGQGGNTYNDPLSTQLYSNLGTIPVLSWSSNGYLDPSDCWISWDFMDIDATFDYVESFRMKGIPHLVEDLTLQPTDWQRYIFMSNCLNQALLGGVFGIKNSQILSIISSNIFYFFRQLNILSYRKGFTPLLPPLGLQNLFSTPDTLGINVVHINASSIAYMLLQKDWSISINETNDLRLASELVEDFITSNASISACYDFIRFKQWNWMTERDQLQWIIDRTKFRSPFFKEYYSFAKKMSFLDRRLFDFKLGNTLSECANQFAVKFLDDLRYFNIYDDFTLHIRLIDMKVQLRAAGRRIINIDAESNPRPIIVDMTRLFNRMQYGAMSENAIEGVRFNYPSKIHYVFNDRIEPSDWKPTILKAPVTMEMIIKNLPIPHTVNLRLANVTNMNIIPDTYFGAIVRTFTSPDFVSYDVLEFINQRVFIITGIKVLDIFDDSYVSAASGTVL